MNSQVRFPRKPFESSKACDSIQLMNFWKVIVLSPTFDYSKMHPSGSFRMLFMLIGQLFVPAHVPHHIVFSWLILCRLSVSWIHLSVIFFSVFWFFYYFHKFFFCFSYLYFKLRPTNLVHCTLYTINYIWNGYHFIPWSILALLVRYMAHTLPFYSCTFLFFWFVNRRTIKFMHVLSRFTVASSRNLVCLYLRKASFFFIVDRESRDGNN